MINKIERKKTDYIVACVNEFSRVNGLNIAHAYRYLEIHGGIDFLVEHYDTEHTLSIDDAIEDLKTVSRQTGGQI